MSFVDCSPIVPVVRRYHTYTRSLYHLHVHEHKKGRCLHGRRVSCIGSNSGVNVSKLENQRRPHVHIQNQHNAHTLHDMVYDAAGRVATLQVAR